MPRFLFLLALTLALGLVSCSQIPAPATAVAPAPPWPHEISDLKPDPTVVWGRLENGLRYAILPHATPRERVSVFLLVQVGSFHERDDERGYAHYIEHMAFRGTRDFPGDSVIQTLQRLGLHFGAHVNAATSPFHTSYYFDNLPSDDPVALATGLKLLRSMADGVLFDEDAVDQERNVIFSEQRHHQGQLAHAWRDELEFLPPLSQELRWPELATLFDNTRLANRAPIGTEETLRAATPKQLRTFYDHWYRPERMVLTVAGDVSLAEAEHLIRENFSTFTARGRPPAEIPIVDSAPRQEGPLEIIGGGSVNEPAARLTLCAIHPYATPDTIDRRRRTLTQQLALALLERRLLLAAETPDAPYTDAEALLSHEVPGKEISLLRASSRPEAWPAALTALNTETRRAHKHGFSEAEFQRAVKRQTTRLQVAARQAAHQSSSDLARALAFATASGVVFTAVEDDLRLTEILLASLTVEQCDAALRVLLPAGRMKLALYGPFVDEKGLGDLALANAAWSESTAAELTPYEPAAPATSFPYTDFGPPGEVMKTLFNPVLDATLITFANGVRLNLKRTDFEPGRVRIAINFGGGRLDCPADLPGLDLRFFVWIFGGLVDLSPDELSAALADLSDGFQLRVNSGSFRLGSRTGTLNLRLAMQAFAAYFAHPAYREETWPRTMEFVRQAVAPMENTAAGVAEAALAARMTGRHPGFHYPTLNDASQRSLEEFKAWFPSILASAPLEITLVGDFVQAEAIDIIAQTLGALPGRATEDLYATRRSMTLPTQPFSDTISFSGDPGVAVTSLAWAATDVTSVAERFGGNILARILEDRLRLKLRSEMGATYSPTASFKWNDAFTPSPTFLQCRVESSPEQAGRVTAAAHEVAEILARDGATNEEFERTRRPIVREAEADFRSNDWWLDTLEITRSQPANAEAWGNAVALYQSATLDEINALARTLLTPERQCQLIVLPK